MTFISVHSIQSKSVVLTDVLPRGKKIVKAPTTSGHVTLRKTEKLLLKTLKGDSPCDFPSTARKKKDNKSFILVQRGRTKDPGVRETMELPRR